MSRRCISGSRMLITGASQGIGRALAEAAAARGAKVLAVARSEPLLRELAGQVHAQGGHLETLAVDIIEPADRERIVEVALDRFGGLDILVNNAGIGATGHFVEASPERLRKIMEVNFFGMTEMVRCC